MKTTERRVISHVSLNSAGRELSTHFVKVFFEHHGVHFEVSLILRGSKTLTTPKIYRQLAINFSLWTFFVSFTVFEKNANNQKISSLFFIDLFRDYVSNRKTVHTLGILSSRRIQRYIVARVIFNFRTGRTDKVTNITPLLASSSGFAASTRQHPSFPE